MHYIIKYCSISPTYVSVPAEPSSGGQGYIHITSTDDIIYMHHNINSSYYHINRLQCIKFRCILFEL
jgi:hypothetical protein